MDLAPRWVALVALAALLPGSVYLTARDDPVVAVALVNVALVAGSLWVALGHDERDGRGAPGT